MAVKKRLAIKDIAQQLNISQTTVSFVLNGKAKIHGISENLEKKILSYIEHVGYIPSKIAQGLRTGKSKTIGMIIEDISDPFFSSISRIVEEIAYKKGYRVIFGSSENDPDKTMDLIQSFKNHHVDGYIIAPPPGIDENIQELIDDNFPVVLFDRNLLAVSCPKIVVDNFNGTTTAIEHLLKNGYDQIAMITLNSDQDQMQDRLNAFKAVMQNHRLNPIIKMITYHEDKAQSINSIQTFLKANKQLNALFFSTNYLAMSGLEAIKLMGIAISKDIGVVVFDDNPAFALFNPSITAVAQPIAEIAANVIYLLLEQLETGEVKKMPACKTLTTSLIIRDSSIKPNRQVNLANKLLKQY